MSVTGYEFTYRDTTVGICPSHRNELGIPEDDCTTIHTSMYRHGNGGSPCAVCGFDVLHALAGRALSDRHDTPRKYATVEDRDPLPLGMCAALISHSKNLDCWAFIALAPGEEPEEIPFLTNDSGDVIAKQVQHGEDATETLYVELSNRTAEYTYQQTHERATHIQSLLHAFGLHTRITPHPFETNGDYWHIHGIIP